MQVIIAPDKFKGSLTSFEVCDAIRDAFRMAGKPARLYSYPMADGGDGFAAIMKFYRDTETIFCQTVDPIGRSISAAYEWNDLEKIAIIEMAVASGLVLLQPAERNPMVTSTYGTGILIKHAIGKGAKTIMLGLGGSATNDGGMGILSALGFRFENQDGRSLPAAGENLVDIKNIIVPSLLPSLRIQIACDVQNTLYGTSGAAFIYAAQKGATASQINSLDNGLRNFAAVLLRITGRPVAEIPGTGAAGGIAAGLMSFFDAELIRGIEIIIASSKMKEKLSIADLLITGEGRLDSQSLEGKVVGHIASLAKEYGIPCIAVCGQSDLDEVSRKKTHLREIISLTDKTVSADQAMSEAKTLLVKKLSSYLNEI